MEPNEVLAALAQALGNHSNAVPQYGVKHDSPTGTPSTPYMHGPDGLWSMGGIERDIISTRVQPRGLAGSLPSRGNQIMHPYFAYLTSFGDPSGSDPEGVCDDPQVAGAMRNCIQTAQFGRYSYMTREMEVNRVGQVNDRTEVLDLRIMNDPLLAPGTNGNGIVRPGMPGGVNLRREALVRMIELGITFQNKLMKQLYYGNPTNNSAGKGYQEFPGLDLLIGTGKRDAFTGTACPSLDSDIKDFNYAHVDDQSADIVNVITNMARYLRSIAEGTNMDPVRWAFVMRENLFYEITKAWPCSYLTYGCNFRAVDGTQVLNVSGDEQIRFRDAMRNGRYLLIDGIQYEVILDSAIEEESSGDTSRVGATCFASDIYVVPMSVRGAQSVTFWEYFDYAGPNGTMQAIQDSNMQGYFWSDGGRYLWHAKPPKNWCVQWLAKIEPRLVLMTPHLAGRLLNVQYCPLQHTRDPFSDDNYFFGGGVEARSTAPSLYPSW